MRVAADKKRARRQGNFDWQWTLLKIAYAKLMTQRWHPSPYMARDQALKHGRDLLQLLKLEAAKSTKQAFP